MITTLLALSMAAPTTSIRRTFSTQDDIRALIHYGETQPDAVRDRAALAAYEPLPFPLGDVVGFADLHAHPLSELGFDGRVVVAGTPPCDGRWHGLRYDLSRVVSAMPELLESPVFVEMLRHCPTGDFPSWRAWTHEQYAVQHLSEARRDGLRLMVASAVNNQVLCGLSADYGRDLDDLHIWWREKPAVSQCMDSVNIHRQLRAAWEVSKKHPWFHIALTALEANHAMAAGRIAVLLGVEGSDYLNPDQYGGIAGALLRPQRRPVDTAKTVADRLERMGVRVVIPMHEWTNDVGGSAFQNLAIFQGGYALTRRWRREDELQLPQVLEQLLRFRILYNSGAYARWPMPATRLSDVLPDSVSGTAPIGRADQKDILVNAAALSPYGEALIQELGARQIILDLTHMSERALHDTFSIFARPEAPPFPSVIVSHSTPRSMSLRPPDELEYPVSDATYSWIVRKGGLVALQTVAEPSATAPGARISNVCPGSSRSLAQMVHHLHRITPFLAWGTDMNGGGIAVAPRRGPEGCSVNVAPAVAESLTRFDCLVARQDPPEAERWVVAGTRGPSPPVPAQSPTFRDTGLSHVGLLADLTEEIESISGPDDDMRGTWWTAQRLVDTWQGAGRAALEPHLHDEQPWVGVPSERLIVTEDDLVECGIDARSSYPGMTIERSNLEDATYAVVASADPYPAWYFERSNEGSADWLGVDLTAGGSIRRVAMPLFRGRAADACQPEEEEP